MARILISYNSRYGDQFYIDIKDVLINEGNDVFLVNWNNRCKIENNNCVDISEENITQKILSFSPQITFCFNAYCPTFIADNLDSPIYIFEADMPYLYQQLNGYDSLEKLFQKENVFYVSMDSGSPDLLKKYLKDDYKQEKILFLPVATSVIKQEMEIKRNIFFCGSNWYGDCVFPVKVKEHNEAVKFLYNRFKNLSYNSEHIDINESIIISHFAGQERLKYLSMLVDLGLEIYGKDWEYIGLSWDAEFLQICRDKLILEKSISNYYNSSKICVNFSHPQSINSFSFRVMDIMASNSCVLTEDKKDWHLLFDKYVSKEVQDAILYRDRYDMREKAIKLLNDEKLRKRCVSECNHAIDKNGRWKIRFKGLQDFSKIKLISCNSKKGKSIEYLYKEEQQNNTKTPSNIKNCYYGLALILSAFPVLNKFFDKKRIIRSIIKNTYNEQYLEYHNIERIENYLMQIYNNKMKV